MVTAAVPANAPCSQACMARLAAMTALVVTTCWQAGSAHISAIGWGPWLVLRPLHGARISAASALADSAASTALNVPCLCWLLCCMQVRFLSAPDPNDPVVKSHYRMMRHFIADDPKPLVPGQHKHKIGAALSLVDFRLLSCILSLHRYMLRLMNMLLHQLGALGQQICRC